MAKLTHTNISIGTDGVTSTVHTNRALWYEDTRRDIGNIIQQLPGFQSFLGKRCSAWVDEEGLLRNLKYNQKASTLWYEGLPQGAQRNLTPGACRVVGPLIISIKGLWHLDTSDVWTLTPEPSEVVA